MVSILWGTSALDERIEKATSEFMPSGEENLGLQLDISDDIRSKKISAKDAMQAMKKRLGHKNPNVQLATLSLVDTCVKNSGDAYVREIGSREFMDELATMVRRPTLNVDVKTKVLDSVQTWGIAAKGNPALGYMTDTYSLLRAEGHVFPSVKQNIDSILLEASAAPEWGDSSVCERCRTPFTMTNRKHHCRNCGGTFCQECSSRAMALPHLAINDPVRVCDGCHLKLKMYKTGQGSLPVLPSPNKNTFSDATPVPTTAATSNGDLDAYDDDLKKAIELSLAEDEKRKNGFGSGYQTSSTINNTSYSPSQSQVANDDSEDPDLTAAIAASLREMEIASPPQVNHQHSTTLPNYDLSPTEMENIQLFSTLMEHVHARGGNVANDPQINKLYTQIGSLQPKLIRSLDDTIQKHRSCVELHDKINKVVVMYDRLLEQRMSGYRSGPTGYPYYGSTDPTAIPNSTSTANPPQYAPDYQGHYQHSSGTPPPSSAPYGTAPVYPSSQQQQQAMYPPSVNPMNHQPIYTHSVPPQQQPAPNTQQQVEDERPLIDL
ncbi:hypothetical protein BC941DRAFT_408256 [Chlamydoabsidia padenii]|nr:hypothetical protein BC941DRAFT_408256 [Chlamydoabsidia padenii]